MVFSRQQLSDSFWIAGITWNGLCSNLSEQQSVMQNGIMSSGLCLLTWAVCNQSCFSSEFLGQWNKDWDVPVYSNLAADISDESWFQRFQAGDDNYLVLSGLAENLRALKAPRVYLCNSGIVEAHRSLVPHSLGHISPEGISWHPAELAHSYVASVCNVRGCSATAQKFDRALLDMPFFWQEAIEPKISILKSLARGSYHILFLMGRIWKPCSYWQNLAEPVHTNIPAALFSLQIDLSVFCILISFLFKLLLYPQSYLHHTVCNNKLLISFSRTLQRHLLYLERP